MKRLSLVLFCGILFLSCKSKLINQKIDHKKEGVWIDDYSEDGMNIKSYEYYKHDKPVKKWKTYNQGEIYKTEKYKSEVCIVKYYHENGKLQSKGKTRVQVDSIETHWFYFGVWKFYSDKGKLTEIKNYDNGQLISEQKI